MGNVVLMGFPSEQEGWSSAYFTLTTPIPANAIITVAQMQIEVQPPFQMGIQVPINQTFNGKPLGEVDGRVPVFPALPETWMFHTNPMDVRFLIQHLVDTWNGLSFGTAIGFWFKAELPTDKQLSLLIYWSELEEEPIHVDKYTNGHVDAMRRTGK